MSETLTKAEIKPGKFRRRVAGFLLAATTSITGCATASPNTPTTTTVPNTGQCELPVPSNTEKVKIAAGDSTTAGFNGTTSWAKQNPPFSSNTFEVVAHGGDWIPQIETNLLGKLRNCKPEDYDIYFMGGANNIMGDQTTEAMLSQLEQVESDLHNIPDSSGVNHSVANIHFLTVTPFGSAYPSFENEANALNTAIRQTYGDSNMLVDCGDSLKGGDGFLAPSFAADDKVHHNELGALTFANCVYLQLQGN